MVAADLLPELRASADRPVDVVSLGEVMLRLDPGEARIRCARSFAVHEGGGEYNVARALSHTFGRTTAAVTALVDNEVGRLVESLMRGGGVDVGHVRWLPFDGVGRTVRNGLNFTERGFGIRPPLGVSDRGHGATSALAPGDVDWESVLGPTGGRWLHTGGVFAGLSESTSAVALEAMTAARRLGAVVSYDLNHRPSLWQDRGGDEAARQVHAQLLPHAHVVLGSAHHVAAALGHEAETAVGSVLPDLRVLAGTRRQVDSASVHGWTGEAWTAEGGLVSGRAYERLQVLDRVGSGDAFAAGVIHGLLAGQDAESSLELGLAAGALAMTTPGDSLSASAAEVLALAGGAAEFVR